MATGEPLEACPACDRIYARAEARRADLEPPPPLARRAPAPPLPGEIEAHRKLVASRGRARWWIGAVVVGLLALAAAPREEEPSRGVAVSRGERHQGAAAAACRAPLQEQARWDYEWTDGLLTPMFDQYALQVDRSIIYRGSKLKLQNGFGAWRHVSYLCQYHPEQDRVVRAVIDEG